ncbi:MAG: protein phosphatase CheZ, partial [Rhodospirillaceae bacterium]|nr:protein phosphatase CheZ [Rhodospirillaceae bacterium]
MAEKYQNKLFSAEKKIIEKSGGPLQPSGHSAIHTEEVLNAIAEVKKLIEQSSSAPQSVTDMPEMSVLRGQLHDLKESIDKTKSEIAAIHRPGEQEDKFVSAALELSAIVSATEEATNNILGAAEDIEDLAQQLRDRLDDVKALENVNKISELVIGIFENCNFQDITGQRTSKVVKTINYLEDRILT